MRTIHLDGRVAYDGRQLGTGFVDRYAEGEADVVILFVGEAHVRVEDLVDLEDARAGAFIYSPLMAHVIVEHRNIALPEAVCRQRLLVRLGASWIASRAGTAVEVRGDDLFIGEAKLSVSVATRSNRSCLIHLGVNVDTEGTPVVTSGLRELRIPARDFLRAVGQAYAEETASIAHATGKVRPVS